MKMRIPLVAALAVIVSLAACSDMPSAYSPDEANFKALSVAADVVGSFNIVTEGSGEGYTYTGTNSNVAYCDDEGRARRTNGSEIPGQNQYCIVNEAGSTTHYTVVWNARYVANKNNTHLNFENDGANVHHNQNRGVIGQGLTLWAPVFLAGTDEQVGTAQLDLSQYTAGEFVGFEEGFACLHQSPAVTIDWDVDGVITSAELASLCW